MRVSGSRKPPTKISSTSTRKTGTAGYASDPVAEFFENLNRQITNFFESKGDSGSSVSVNEDDAIAWIKQHRPHLAEKMSA